MGVSPHTAVAIAQIALFAPLAPLTTYLLIRNWKYRPRTAWYPPAIFSLIRTAGGVVTIIEEQNPSKEIVITTIILLNIGLIPLLLAYLGYARLVLERDFGEITRVKLFLRILKVMILISTGLLGAAGGDAGKPEKADEQATLSRAAYALFVIVLVALIASFVGLSLNLGQIRRANRIYVKWALVAAVPLVVRAIYGILGVALAAGVNIFTSDWSPLFGSAVAFGLMGLLPEFVVVCIYVYLSMHYLRTAKREADVEGRSKQGLSDTS
ncbi:hypothetical protein QBC47DRAFT_82935 [Echria macrotheca]|uniref:DUF7702 domain-containing protein n=1 Tax=Echria macrotheca TaxID=438768 RepID=A0AAJ0F1R6_9PEZI|nr:hypothetical protein QBC47DRAFT_82935 [Echria macrotheca]